VIELALVVGVVGGVIGATALVALTPWWWLFGGGWLLVALGMAVGVPAGVWYHVLLYRILSPRAELPQGWWVRPYQAHGALREQEKKRVMWWFRLGAVGWAAAMLGCVFVGVGAWRS
jgi:hypothetical protein